MYVYMITSANEFFYAGKETDLIHKELPEKLLLARPAKSFKTRLHGPPRKMKISEYDDEFPYPTAESE